jgi:hypothetical protein
MDRAQLWDDVTIQSFLSLCLHLCFFHVHIRSSIYSLSSNNRKQFNLLSSHRWCF